MSDLLQRLNSHISLMAPHQKEREQGKLLIEARDAIRDLHGVLAFSRFEHVLRKHNLIDPAALDDPEGFDNYRTHGSVHAAHRELIQP